MVLYRDYIKDGRVVKTEIEDLPLTVDGMQVRYSLGYRSNEVYSYNYIDPIDYIKSGTKTNKIPLDKSNKK